MLLHDMECRLFALSLYKNMLDLPVTRCLQRICQTEDPLEQTKAYTEIVYLLFSEEKETLSDYYLDHFLHDDSVVGRRAALGTISGSMEKQAGFEIELISSLAQIPSAEIRREIQRNTLDASYEKMIGMLPDLPAGDPLDAGQIMESYRKNGCGIFSMGKAFHWEKGTLTRVQNPDQMTPEDMIGYEMQREKVYQNTRALAAGRAANNVLLYGDSGTGKSATVKSLIHIEEFWNLRIVQVAKNSLDSMTELIRMLGSQTQKFILYIDDLSFEKEDKGFSALKTALEGGMEHMPDNVAIYATSNRRHLIHETFSDREGDMVHVRETMEERTSLSERFGLRIPYLALDKAKYNHMVLEMAAREGISLPEEELLKEANIWELQHGGRTPRVVVQLIDHLAASEKM